MAILGLGIGMFAAICEVTAVSGFRTGWQGIPVYLAIAGFLGRIANCKAILRENVLVVVNPLRTHVLPRALIRGASLGEDGTLRVDLEVDRSISVFAFGGSFVDRFRNTSGEATRKIGGWLQSGSGAGGTDSASQVRWTRCRPADLSLVLCAVTAGAGATWMLLTGGA
ncbi:hypothetical protein [Streptomyces sp. NPDC056670]|uniref:hypothetical protein n=1 Tax=Streptomyces sp. NPDC056670 TaxID=3345904 RepID=UPI00367616CD